MTFLGIYIPDRARPHLPGLCPSVLGRVSASRGGRWGFVCICNGCCSGDDSVSPAAAKGSGQGATAPGSRTEGEAGGGGITATETVSSPSAGLTLTY